MDELLVTWLSSDNVFENVLNLIETYRSSAHNTPSKTATITSPPSSPPRKSSTAEDDAVSDASPRGVAIPPFYRPAGTVSNGVKAKPIRKYSFDADQSWDGIYTNKDIAVAADAHSLQPAIDSAGAGAGSGAGLATATAIVTAPQPNKPIKEQVADIFNESGKDTADATSKFLTMDNFVKITKEICSFPTFFNGPLYKRILYLWNTFMIKSDSQRLVIWNEFQKEDLKVGLDPNIVEEGAEEKNELLEHLDTVITKEIFEWYWGAEMEDFDPSERFFRLLKKPFTNYIGKPDFLPYMKELLRDHPVS